MKKIYKFIEIIFSIIFLLIFIGGIFLNTSQIKRLDTSILLVGTPLIFLLIVFIYYIYNKNVKDISDKKEKIILIIGSIIILTILIVLGFLLQNYGDNRNNPSGIEWDLRIVIRYINSYINKTGFLEPYEIETISYMSIYNNINGLIFILVPIYKLFKLIGINNPLYPGIIVNIVFIFISIFSMYLIVRKLYDKKKATFIFLSSILLTPIYLYSSVFYSDTISMPFIILQVVVYLYTRDSNKSKIGMLLMILFAFLGFIVKPTSIFMTIAIIFDLIIKKRKKALKSCLVGLVLFILLFVSYKFYFNITYDMGKRSNKIPYTHFIMMGLNNSKKDNLDEGQKKIITYGTFSFDDIVDTTYKDRMIFWYLYNEDYPYYSSLMLSDRTYKEKEIYNLKMIWRRLKKFKIIGLTNFLYRKMLQTWADGTCYAPIKLGRGYKYRNILGEVFRVDGKYFDKYNYISHFIHLSIILLVILGSYNNYFEKKYKDSFLKISIIILFLFLCIWETRSRYIVNYLPILYILTVPGYEFIYKKIISITDKLTTTK